LWTPDGAIHDLGFSGEARLINEAGLVVGLSFFDGAAHLVVWTPAGGAPILGHLGGGGMEVRDLNDAGQFVGDGTAGPAESRAFIGTVDGLAEIGTLGGAFSRARALNEAGTVVGDSSTSDGQTRAFAWTPGGGMEDLGPATEPFVNNPSSGGAAFVSPDDSGEPQAFLWDPDRGFFPLGNPGGGSFESLAVNSLGQVAATVVTSTGEFRSFFWPGPEAEDTTPPQILAASADPSAVWPPNHEMVDVRLTVEVVDDTDPSPTCRIVSVASSDPEEGPTFGPHAPDWLVTGDLTLLVRAERYRGDRTYTITIECADASGNVSTASLHVVVPHSRRR
jgi:probable HAF family extracellular repeat protein